MKEPSQTKILDSHPSIELLMESLVGADDMTAILKALIKGAKAVQECEVFEETAPRIFQACKDIVDAQSGYVAVLSEEGEENMVVHLDPGPMTCGVDTEISMPIRGLREKAYSQAKVVYDNVFQDSGFIKFLPDGHIHLKNVLFAPLVHNGSAVGLIGLANKENGFDERDALLAGIFSDMAVTALVNSRNLDGLRDSEMKYRSLFDQAGDAIFILDPETLRFIDVNFTAVNQLGYTREEFLGGMTVNDITGEDTLPMAEVLMNLNEKGTVIYRSIHIARDGRQIPVDINSSIIEYHGKKIVQSFARDISERKEWEKTLSDKRLLDSILNSTTDMFFLKDRNGVTRAVNPAFCRYIGKNEEEILGKNNYDIFPEKYAQIYTRDDNRVMEEGISLELEEEGSTPAGKKRWYRVLKNPVLGEKGETWGVIVLISDITERKNAEEALKNSEANYRYILTKAPVMIHSIDNEARLINVSDKWLEVMGYDRDEVIGRKSIEFLTEESRQEVVEKRFPEFFRTGSADNVPLQFVKKNGEMMDVLLSARSESDELGSITLDIAAITDVTELKKAEKELIFQQDKLRLLSSQQALSEERQRREIARELHDQVGQNLSIAKVNLMRAKKVTDKKIHDDIIEDVTDNLDKVIKSTRTLVFDLSPPVLYELGLEAAIDWMCEEMENRSGVRIVFIKPDQLQEISEDLSVILFQVAKELLVNVLKHASAAQATVSLLMSNSSIVLKVTDDGKGFPIQDPKMMSASEKGYGLFSVKEKIGLLRGDFRISSMPGVSTTVTVTIPLSSKTGSEGEWDVH